MQKYKMKNQTKQSIPEISWEFSLVHSFIDFKNLDHITSNKLSFINNFSYEDVNIDTYYAINFIIQKIENIYDKEIDNINISVKKAVNLVVQKLRKSLNIWDKLLYQKLEIHQLEKKIDILKQETITDPLTWILNRRWICDEFKKIIALKNRNHVDSSILIIDIDHFKKINDTYWHDVWDIVLIEICKMFKNELRWSDVVWRLWGEEFIIIMYWANIEWAFDKANDIRKKVQEHLYKNINNIKNEITISIWVSQTKIEDETYLDIIKKADNALLDAKQSGRNCVHFEI